MPTAEAGGEGQKEGGGEGGRGGAQAWSGVAYAEFRSDELSTCYEARAIDAWGPREDMLGSTLQQALCEANLLDNERTDVWALLCLVRRETMAGCFGVQLFN